MEDSCLHLAGSPRDVGNQSRMPGKNEWAVAGYSGSWELLMSGTVDYETYAKSEISLFLRQALMHPRLASHLL